MKLFGRCPQGVILMWVLVITLPTEWLDSWLQVVKDLTVNSMRFLVVQVRLSWTRCLYTVTTGLTAVAVCGLTLGGVMLSVVTLLRQVVVQCVATMLTGMFLVVVVVPTPLLMLATPCVQMIVGRWWWSICVSRLNSIVGWVPLTRVQPQIAGL